MFVVLVVFLVAGACVAAASLSEDLVWAAYTDVLSEGTKHRVPVGAGCYNCWEIATSTLGYKTFTELKDLLEQGDATARER